MLLFRCSIPKRIGVRCNGRTGWAAALSAPVLKASACCPSSLAGVGASAASATEADSSAAKQKVILIEPSLQSSKRTFSKTQTANSGKLLRVCGGVYGQMPRSLQVPQVPKWQLQPPERP